jgi:hypothetical protein
VATVNPKIAVVVTIVNAAIIVTKFNDFIMVAVIC